MRGGSDAGYAWPNSAARRCHRIAPFALDRGVDQAARGRGRRAELCARTFRTFPREFSSRNRSGPSRRSPVASSGLSVVSERLMIA